MYAEHFSIANIPYGIASSAAHPTQSVVTRVNDTVFFLDGLVKDGHLAGLSAQATEALSQIMNQLAALPKAETQDLRSKLQKVLGSLSTTTSSSVANISDVTLHLPLDVRGFTDFSCSKEHCLNGSEAMVKKRSLPPAFLRFPIGYTGRASSIVISGTPIIRPKGQYTENGEVVFGASKMVDFELEIGTVIGKPSKFGDSISVEQAEEHIFGLVLINDWSSRDIQALEMSPLGPMNGKSFGTSMSPWIITTDSLANFRWALPERERETSSYLKDSRAKSTYNIHLQADLELDGATTTLCKSEMKWLYWGIDHLVAQQTINGCNINTGDILATGTISGSSADSHGCLLELTKGGEKSFSIAGGKTRTYLEDGDTVKLTAHAGPGVGFGECIGTIVAAR